MWSGAVSGVRGGAVSGKFRSHCRVAEGCLADSLECPYFPSWTETR